MTPEEHIAALQRLVCLYREAWMYEARSVTVGDLRPVVTRAIKEDAQRRGVDDENNRKLAMLVEEVDRGYGLGPGVMLGR